MNWKIIIALAPYVVLIFLIIYFEIKDVLEG